MAKQKSMDERLDEWSGRLWSSLKREKVENPHTVYGWGVYTAKNGANISEVYSSKVRAQEEVEFLNENFPGLSAKVVLLRFEEVA